MRGALNRYVYNGRAYRRTGLAGSATIELTGSGASARLVSLIGSVALELAPVGVLTRARSLRGVANIEIAATLRGEALRIPERIEFMRRPRGDRSFRRPAQTRVMRGEKST